MPRPFTHRQLIENAAFLAALGRTGNARLAARALGVHRATFTKRRAKHPAFAAEWDATLAAAHAAFALAGGARPPGSGDAPDPAALAIADAPAWRAALRTRGGEPTVVRTASGRLQLRLAPPGRMTRAAEQAFLAALAATANVRLAAAAAGFAHTSIYAKRKASPAFAAAMDGALDIGFSRLESALFASTIAVLDGVGPDSAWRDSLDVNPIPPMSVAEALQLVALRRRPATPTIPAARAGRHESAGASRHPDDPPPLQLPPLDQVTGWSKADPSKPPHRAGGGLFGGWRIDDWKKRTE
ncbi:MAG: hypothetical protein V4574_21380 [Pseudomonadota bacterium]